MDRRHFLKSSVAGAGVLAVSSTLAGTALEAAESVSTPLHSDGYVREPAKRIPVVDKADIVVVGGGPAGFAAAVSAARQGLDVILLEREYFLGGLFTGCGVTPVINMFQPRRDGRKEQAVAGICQEFCDALDAAGMLCTEAGCRPKVDPEAAKYFMEEMISSSGVRMIYGVSAAEVVTRGDAIDAVILEGKSGRVAVRAGFFIDCTGDGDILSWVGEDFTVVKSDIGAMWRIGHADNCTKGSSTPIRGERTLHTKGELEQDGLDMYNRTRVQVKLRKMMWDKAMELRKAEGCSELYLIDTPSIVGVRVTRVLNSVANVTLEGAAQGKTYRDVIGLAGGDSTLRLSDMRIKKYDRRIWQIPYSSIVPKKVPNLLVGGRCFGYEKGLTYDAREIGTCFVTGQAAGTAAALAVLNRCSNRTVDVPLLQKTLLGGNVKLAV